MMKLPMVDDLTIQEIRESIKVWYECDEPENPEGRERELSGLDRLVTLARMTADAKERIEELEKQCARYKARLLELIAARRHTAKYNRSVAERVLVNHPYCDYCGNPDYICYCDDPAEMAKLLAT